MWLRRLARSRPGAVVVLALLLALGALVVALSVGRWNLDAASARRAAQTYTPPPFVPPTSAPPLVAVIGDQTALAPAGTQTSQTWPALVQVALGVQVIVTAGPGAGYLTAGSGTDPGTFGDRALRISGDARVVVLFGGNVDRRASAPDIVDAATRAIAAAKASAPDAQIVVVAPIGIDRGNGASATVDPQRASLRSAAAAGGARFFDPVASGWLAAQDLTPAGGLTAVGQTTLADRMVTALEPLVD